jgi:hypothetical protein
MAREMALNGSWSEVCDGVLTEAGVAFWQERAAVLLNPALVTMSRTIFNAIKTQLETDVRAALTGKTTDPAKVAMAQQLHQANLASTPAGSADAAKETFAFHGKPMSGATPPRLSLSASLSDAHTPITAAEIPLLDAILTQFPAWFAICNVCAWRWGLGHVGDGAGITAVYTAMQLCDTVDLFGFDPYTEATSTPYHYFDQRAAMTWVHSFDLAMEVYRRLGQHAPVTVHSWPSP